MGRSGVVENYLVIFSRMSTAEATSLGQIVVKRLFSLAWAIPSGWDMLQFSNSRQMQEPLALANSSRKRAVSSLVFDLWSISSGSVYPNLLPMTKRAPEQQPHTSALRIPLPKGPATFRASFSGIPNSGA